MGLSSVAVIAQGAPVVLETLFTHYFNRKKTVKDSAARSELLFDEAFSVMKSFLEIATKNTVEDLQRFSNVHLPSPPSILVVPVLIPLPTCASAAGHLVRAFGGEAEARRVVGGTEWWRVRGIKGVEGEWIVGKRMWAEREKAAKAAATESQGKAKAKKGKARVEDEVEEDEEADLDRMMGEEHMDDMRCMLYIHGGAYYWGSINTHRYTIWRYARKMKGRAFAVNYRKAPQYPFPCALQDALAAYLYLLDPPPGAKHTAIKPHDIVLAGDSAGGGLTLALLMVLRDAGLPLPAGAVAISPWLDLTHGFPSTMDNFATDVMPPYGFVHKPSTLWPPPEPELSETVQRTLRARVKEAVDRLKRESTHPTTTAEEEEEDGEGPSSGGETDGSDDERSDGRSTPSAPVPAAEDDRHTTVKGDAIRLPVDPPLPTTTTAATTTSALAAEPSAGGAEDSGPAKRRQHAVDPTGGGDLYIEIDGKEQVIHGQIQHYATNALLPHPYVSPAFGYLGGLCPLLVIASDKELLRDEIIYAAHKAAHPERFPIPPHVIRLMPHLEGIHERYGPTKVHLQVYDEVCHVLPLYSMTTPAKYCFRAIATFCKYVTSAGSSSASTSTSSAGGGRRVPSPSPLLSPATSVPGTPEGERESEVLDLPNVVVFDGQDEGQGAKADRLTVLTTSPQASIDVRPGEPGSPSPTTPVSNAGGGGGKRRWLTVDGTTSPGANDGAHAGRSGSTDVAGPRFRDAAEPPPPEGPETAGHPSVYACEGDHPDPFVDDGMIRERISTRGLRRPLEPEVDLPALHVPFDELGMIKELPAKRYLTGQTLWDKKFAHAARRVERNRRKNLARSQKDAARVVSAWQARLARPDAAGAEARQAGEEFLLRSGSAWDWALKGERPPPSAVVSRRDTGEAVKLAKIADQSEGDSKLGGVNLWTSAIDLLTRSGSGLRSPKHAGDASTSTTTSASSGPTTGPSTPRRHAHPSKGPSPLSAPGSGHTSAAEASDVEGSTTSGGVRSRTGSRLQMPSFLRRATQAGKEEGEEGERSEGKAAP